MAQLWDRCTIADCARDLQYEQRGWESCCLILQRIKTRTVRQMLLTLMRFLHVVQLDHTLITQRD